MADIKYAGLPPMPTSSQQSTDIMATSDAAGTPGKFYGETRIQRAQWILANAITYGDGIKFTAPTTISVDASVSNFTFVGGVLNTAQDIYPAASPTFASMTLDSGPLDSIYGFKSYQSQLILASSQNVDDTIVGQTVVNDTVASQTLTIVQGDTLPDGSSFEMIRAGTGAFSIAWPNGVSVNGVNGPGTISLPQQYDRGISTKLKTDNYTYIEYSASSGTVTWQDLYKNSAAQQSWQQIDGSPVSIKDQNSNDAFVFDTDTSVNSNIYRIKNSLGSVELSLQNDVSPGIPQIIAYHTVAGRNTLSQQIIYSQIRDDVIDATAGSEKVKRDFFGYEAITGLVKYFGLNTNTKKMNIWKDINFQSDTSAVPDFGFFSNVTGSTNQPVLQLSSRSFDSSDNLKTSNSFGVQTSDPAPSTFSQRVFFQGYMQNGLKDIFDFDGTDGSTKILNRNSGLPDQVLTEDDLASVISENFAQMTITNGASVTLLPAQGSAVKIAGTYVAGKISNFSLLNGVLTWNGPDQRDFIIVASATLKPQNASTDTFSTIIYQNGVTPISESEAPAYFGPTVPEQTTITQPILVTLDPADSVELRAINKTSNGNNVIGTFAKFVIFQVPGTASGGGGSSNASSGDSGLSFVSSVGAGSFTIDTQLYLKIDNITHYNASISFTPTSNVVALTMGTPAVGNLIESNGSGSISSVDLESNISTIGLVSIGTGNPNTSFPLGVWTNVISSWVSPGNNLIPANSLSEGDIIKYTIKGDTNTLGPSGGTVRLRVLLNGVPILTSQSLQSSTLGTGSWELDYSLRLNSFSQLIINAQGTTTKSNATSEDIYFGSAPSQAINVAGTNSVDVELIADIKNINYLFVATNTTITKIVSGGSSKHSTEFRSISAVPSSKNVIAAFTIADENINKPQRLNLSFSYEE